MFNKLLLTFYYVWFQGHKRSKYAKDFSHHWLHAFFQVSITFFLLMLSAIMVIEKIFPVKIVYFSYNKWLTVFLYFVLPSVLLYYYLFSYLKAEKENDDPSHLGIEITKTKKIFSWVAFFLAPVGFFLLLALGFRK